MNVRLPARIGAYACLGVALAMAALALRDPSPPADDTPSPTETAAPADPLKASLLRCQQAGEAAASDYDCLAAWAENRRRFLGLGRARPAEPAPAALPENITEPVVRDANASVATEQDRER